MSANIRHSAKCSLYSNYVKIEIMISSMSEEIKIQRCYIMVLMTPR